MQSEKIYDTFLNLKNKAMSQEYHRMEVLKCCKQYQIYTAPAYMMLLIINSIGLGLNKDAITTGQIWSNIIAYILLVIWYFISVYFKHYFNILQTVAYILISLSLALYGQGSLAEQKIGPMAFGLFWGQYLNILMLNSRFDQKIIQIVMLTAMIFWYTVKEKFYITSIGYFGFIMVQQILKIYNEDKTKLENYLQHKKIDKLFKIQEQQTLNSPIGKILIVNQVKVFNKEVMNDI